MWYNITVVIEMKQENTCDRLKKIMSIRGFKQIDVLNKSKFYCNKYNIKLGRNDLSQYLSGKVSPGQTKLTVLALTLDVNEAWLMGFDVPMERTNDKPIEIKEIPPHDFETIARNWVKTNNMTPEEKQRFLRELSRLIDEEN